MKRFVESESVDNGKLTMTHEPDANPENPELNRDYHRGVRGIKYDDIMIELLLARCFTECYPAADKSG